MGFMVEIELGALRYLNALPLVAGLESRAKVSYAIPSLLARDLRSGEFDLALVPQVEATRDRNYRIVPGCCVSCAGPVDSILLFTTRSWSEIRRVGVDLSSNTSVELLRVLFHLKGAPIPELTSVPPRLDPLRRGSSQYDPELDGILLIGDRALAEDHGEFPRFDLGALWWEQTGRPFVFAVWLGRESAPAEAVHLVRETLAHNLPRRSELAGEFVREHPGVIDESGARRYLSETIRYHLGDAEVDSLREFHRLRVEIGSVSDGWWPSFFEDGR